MNQETEIINSSRMTVLSEFPVEYENDEQITKPEDAEKADLYICSLDENIVVAYRSAKTGRRISELVFEKTNVSAVAGSVDKLLETENPWDAPLEIESGRDKILITYSSSWAGNLPAPLERINVYNRRDYELDDLRARDVWLSLPPKTARRFAVEMTKLFG